MDGEREVKECCQSKPAAPVIDSVSQSHVPSKPHYDKTSSDDNTNDTQQKQRTQFDIANVERADVEPDENRIVRHIMVIGFHHKHGYQVDYCYPPLMKGEQIFSTPDRPIILPSRWKTLPILCLPDGSHNYDNDTIYFTMPDLNQEDPVSIVNEDLNNSKQDNSSIRPEGIQTIFGTACYRQIPVDKLVNKTDDMTRLSVQKSVCVLSSKPLFGLIRSKLEMITHAYFEELDFSRVKILKLTYDNLNSLLSRETVKESAIHLGLSPRKLVTTFNCNILVLFKAILLEKKILFYKTPVRDLCTTILSMCSLFTGLLELDGLSRSTCDLKLSPTLIEALRLSSSNSTDNLNNCDSSIEQNSFELQSTPVRNDKVFFNSKEDEVTIIPDSSFCDSSLIGDNCDDIDSKTQTLDQHDRLPKRLMNETSIKKTRDHKLNDDDDDEDDDCEDIDVTNCEYEIITDLDEAKLNDNEDTSQIQSSSFQSQQANDESMFFTDDPYIQELLHMNMQDIGFPLQIFSRGSFCLPYLSITYLDLLSDPRVNSFVIGATNFLFKQRRELFDIVVDMDESLCEVDIVDSSLRKCLTLTTEDLRFIDHLNKHVKPNSTKQQVNDEYDFLNADITKWIGSDEWIRNLFKMYTLYLLKASKCNSNTQAFNSSFVFAWRETNNYKIWDSLGKSSVLANLKNKHPFSSTAKGYNFNDVKLRLSYAVNSSEKGKLINQTISGIGKWSIWGNVSQTFSVSNNSMSPQPPTSFPEIQSNPASQQIADNQKKN